MRLALIGSAVVLCVAAVGVRYQLCAAQPPHRLPRHRPEAVRFDQSPQERTWTVSGWGKTVEDANQVAADNARRKVCTYLAKQDPPIHWQPSADYVRQDLIKQWSQPEVKDLPDLGKMYEQTVTVELDARHYRDILEHDRQDRAGERQLMLAKVVGVLLAVLLAVFGYFRLEETTRGYYTLWLRLAAIALVLVSGALLFVR